ncbi:hypothetical protein E2N92_10005 [Methanofollis formosanus]|uniref:Uncharacterized protein n=1 Tax=Methanofollis formosanus TaxID=299308 RepID=A0A8G1A375_9EURY|nr:hypothetical protein [Methanofollis formosanus]QYZ79735.1 hypothetical protein E2N92_10005 [Methanofollis formosanus]
MRLVVLKTVHFILVLVDRTVTLPEVVLIAFRTDLMRPRIGPERALAVWAHPGVCSSADRTETSLFLLLRVRNKPLPTEFTAYTLRRRNFSASRDLCSSRPTGKFTLFFSHLTWHLMYFSNFP